MSSFFGFLDFLDLIFWGGGGSSIGGEWVWISVSCNFVVVGLWVCAVVLLHRLLAVWLYAGVRMVLCGFVYNLGFVFVCAYFVVFCGCLCIDVGFVVSCAWIWGLWCTVVFCALISGFCIRFGCIAGVLCGFLLFRCDFRLYLRLCLPSILPCIPSRSTNTCV